jgi:aminopeptidase YwaD
MARLARVVYSEGSRIEVTVTLSRRNSAIAACLLLAATVAAAPSFSPDAYLRHVKFLASDELAGRGNGTAELDRAADYIAEQFRSIGLQPAGEGGTYFQKLEVAIGSELGSGNRLTLQVGHDTWEAALRRDFLPVAVGEKTRIAGEVVFAGYGISAEEYGYDDYKGLDVTDKVVLVLAHEPRERDPKSPFEGADPTLHGHDNTKAINARYRDARAILIVQDPANHEAGADLPPGAATQADELGIAALRITRDAAARLLRASGKELLELQRQIDEKLAPRSFALPGVSVEIQLDVARVRKGVRNVAGLLPGTDARLGAETVIIGAHYDHLGRGGRSSMVPQLIGQIHNGADDNASGTAGLIELAAFFTADPAPRRRSYLFLAFAAEELGLNGSAYFTKNPTRPLEKTVAMLNMDMIGRLRGNAITIGGVGTSPVFRDLVARAAADAGLEPKFSQSGYGSSDHTSFYAKNVPVLFFFSGLHSDYHRPTDDWDKINAPGATKVLALVSSVASRLNAAEERPAFTKVDEPASTGPVRGGGSGYGAYFGSIPDMTDEVKGVRFADVRPNSPAAKAGLKPGDVLVEFAGREIRNLEDFTYMLRTHKPGETVAVTVLREGKRLPAQVTLEIRR